MPKFKAKYAKYAAENSRKYVCMKNTWKAELHVCYIAILHV